MIEKILKFSIYHPFVVLLFTLLAAGFGIYSFIKLPIDAVPDITNNQVQINTTLPGLSPIQMEKQVTYVIETTLAGIPGLQMTRSLSRNAFSQVTAIFDDDVNIYFARQQINERLGEIKDALPVGAEPKMGAISTGLGEVYMWTVDFKHPNGKGAAATDGSPGWQKNGSYLSLEGYPLKTESEKASYLRTVQEWMIRPQLKSVKGVAGIDSIGGYVRQYHVEPQIEDMLALGLSFEEIISSLKKNNMSIGPGYIEKNGESLLIVADERLNSSDQIENSVVSTREGIPIRIKDIAHVSIGKELRTGSASKNGHEAVVGTALMLIGANSRTVSQAVDEKLQEINKNLPPDIEATAVLNRTKLVNATIATVAKNLGEGALLVIAVLFLFLGQIRAALITAAVIPLSMLMTAIGMVQSKISGNLMSLGAIDFGLIVDGAIIITENCLRKLAEKQQALGRTLEEEERRLEIVSASKEMIQPTVFGQAIIITVYIPILALTGIEGKMFHPMAFTVIYALIAAFILSLTFVPAALSLCIRHVKETESHGMQTLKKAYEQLLEKTLKKPLFSPSIGAAVAAFSLLVFSQLGQEFVPTLDEHDIAMHAIRIPSTSLTQSTEMQTEIEKTLIHFPEVAYVYSKTGTAEMASDPMPPNVSDTFIMLKPKEQWPNPNLSKSELIARIEKSLGELPGNQFEFTQPIEMRFNELISGVRSDLAVKIYGEDFEKMQTAAHQIFSILSKTPGAADVKIAQTKGLPILEVKIDREAAGRLGLNVADGLEVLSIATGGGKAGQIFEGDKRFDIILKLSDTLRTDIKALENLPIPLPPNAAKEKSHFPTIPFSEIATIKVANGFNQINRENGKRFVAVQANVRGRDLGSFVEEAKKEVSAKVKLPEGYGLEWGGQFENLISARQRLLIIAPLCFGLILLFLYMALSSIKDALLVFSGVPLALSGGILSLWLRQMPFSISAAIGLIALSGIAVLNGLVLITSIKQMKEREEKEGRDNLEAVFTSSDRISAKRETPDGVAGDEGIASAIAKETDAPDGRLSLGRKLTEEVNTAYLDNVIQQGAGVRLRPVLMTALVASLGFIPMALAAGTGAEVQKPLATVVIGGLMTSTLLTLFVLPSLYKLFSKKEFNYAE